jgi:hypothetical protein
MTKEIKEYNGIYSWQVKSKTSVVISRPILETDIDYLKHLVPFATYYIPEQETLLLGKYFKIKRTREDSVVIPIENLSLKGNRFLKIRGSVNYNNKKNFILTSDFYKYEDVLDFINRWDETSGNKYFQVRTGKNKYFFKKGFHREGISLFVYDNSKLIGWGVLSNPDINGYSSYVIGKALCLDYRGLSEYVDIKMYEEGVKHGVKFVNLGGGSSAVIDYKLKFPGSFVLKTFDVKINGVL